MAAIRLTPATNNISPENFRIVDIIPPGNVT